MARPGTEAAAGLGTSCTLQKSLGTLWVAPHVFEGTLQASRQALALEQTLKHAFCRQPGSAAASRAHKVPGLSPGPLPVQSRCGDGAQEGSPVVLHEPTCNGARHGRQADKQWQIAAAGGVWQRAPHSPQQKAGEPEAPLHHWPSPEREREEGWGSARAPTCRCRAGECPGARDSSGWKQICHRGMVMAAGSSPALPVLGSAGVGRGHQRTVSTQQPLACELPGCPIPSVSDSRHGDRPDIVLAVTGWTSPPFPPPPPPPSCPTPDPATADAGHAELLLGDTEGLRDGKGIFFPRYPHLPKPTQPSSPRGAGRALTLPTGLPLLWVRL